MIRVLILTVLSGTALCADTVIGDLGAGPVAYAVGPHLIGQTFTVPTPDNVLTQWQFNVAGFVPFRGFTTSIIMTILDWPGLANPVSHFGTSIPWPAAS